MTSRPTWGVLVGGFCFGLFTAQTAEAAGTLTPNASAPTAPALVDHAVRVTLNNGFARTEVTQIFENSSASRLDAI